MPINADMEMVGTTQRKNHLGCRKIYQAIVLHQLKLRLVPYDELRTTPTMALISFPSLFTRLEWICGRGYTVGKKTIIVFSKRKPSR